MAKNMNARIIMKNDSAENWSKATGFRPRLGEIIIYNADIENPSPRIKVGNGKDIPNDLPFVVGADTAIVYLSTRDIIGRCLELPDVYPIQGDSPKLEIISKNILYLYSDTFQSDSLSISPDDSGYIRIIGTPSSDEKITLHKGFSTTLDLENHGIKLPAHGKYTISIDSENHSNTNGIKLGCYFFNEGIQVLHRTFEINNNRFECIVDSKELAFDTIIPYIYIAKNADTTDTPSYRIQIEPGDVATAYTPYKSTFDNKNIISYNRNVFDINKLNPIYLPSIKSGYKIKFGSNGEVIVGASGAYYIKGTVGDTQLGEQFSVYDTTGTIVYNGTYYTPFNTGDKYTFSFVEVNSEELTEMANMQLLLGHTDETEYVTPDIKIAPVSADGSSDYSILQYPYCYLSLQNDDADEYRIHVKFDPALTRDWTEKQLEQIGIRLDNLEENGNGSSADLSNYYTKAEIDSALLNFVDDIVISETEPTVTEETIWLQPITTDTGSVDYIIEQGVDKLTGSYYEKWNNGIIKYYAKEIQSINNFGSGVSFKQYFDIPDIGIKDIVDYKISAHVNLSTDYDDIWLELAANVTQLTNTRCGYVLRVLGSYTDSYDLTNDAIESITIMHQIIGFWK